MREPRTYIVEVVLQVARKFRVNARTSEEAEMIAEELPGDEAVETDEEVQYVDSVPDDSEEG